MHTLQEGKIYGVRSSLGLLSLLRLSAHKLSAHKRELSQVTNGDTYEHLTFYDHSCVSHCMERSRQELLDTG